LGASVLGISLSSSKVAADSIEITDCTTIDEPGEYVLSDDLSSSTDYCLLIYAEDVTIDGQGHTLSGDGTGKGIVVDADGLTVRNLTVTNFEDGIYSTDIGGHKTTLEDSVVTANETGVELTRVSEFDVDNSIITDNGTGIADTAGSQIAVAQSTLTRNNTAVSTSFGNSVELSKSSITENGRGILTGEGEFRDSTIAHNDGNGISLIGFPQGSGLGSATIVGNEIRDNSGVGIEIGYCNADVRKNTISHNQNGVFLTYGGGLGGYPSEYVFSKNNIDDNEEFGIQHQGERPVAVATCNYWGHATGPQHENNPRKNPKGDRVSDNVTFIPWSVNRIQDGNGTCVGGKDDKSNNDSEHPPADPGRGRKREDANDNRGRGADRS
jgi:parallel beta-helix repeat protein